MFSMGVILNYVHRFMSWHCWSHILLYLPCFILVIKTVQSTGFLCRGVFTNVCGDGLWNMWNIWSWQCMTHGHKQHINSGGAQIPLADKTRVNVVKYWSHSTVRKYSKPCLRTLGSDPRQSNVLRSYGGSYGRVARGLFLRARSRVRFTVLTDSRIRPFYALRLPYKSPSVTWTIIGCTWKVSQQVLDQPLVKCWSEGRASCYTDCPPVTGLDCVKSTCTSEVNTLMPRQDGRLFPDDIFKSIFFNENVHILIKISLTFVPKAPINIIPALVQIMAWRRPGDKPLSEPMMVSLLTHICVTRP